MHPSGHRRIVLTGRLRLGNCEKRGQLTVEAAKQVERSREDRRQTGSNSLVPDSPLYIQVAGLRPMATV